MLVITLCCGHSYHTHSTDKHTEDQRSSISAKLYCKSVSELGFKPRTACCGLRTLGYFAVLGLGPFWFPDTNISKPTSILGPALYRLERIFSSFYCASDHFDQKDCFHTFKKMWHLSKCHGSNHIHLRTEEICFNYFFLFLRQDYTKNFNS